MNLELTICFKVPFIFKTVTGTKSLFAQSKDLASDIYGCMLITSASELEKCSRMYKPFEDHLGPETPSLSLMTLFPKVERGEEASSTG